MNPVPEPPETADSLVAAGWKVKRRLIFDRLVGWMLLAAFLAVLFPLFDMIYWVSARALPTLSLATVTENQVGTGGGLYSQIVGTFILIALATAFSAGVGILSGMYTAEYAHPRVARIGRVAGNLLAGVPAIVIGFFGLYALVIYTHSGYTAMAGGVTLGVFMVPYVYRTTDLAFTSVPHEQKEAALAMGATRGQYLLRVALPIAIPTMLTGVFLAMALGLGETSPLIYTAGGNNYVPTSLFQPTGFLTGVIWNFYDFPSTEGQLQTLAFQAAFLLIVIVVGLNVVIQVFAERYRRRLKGLFS